MTTKQTNRSCPTCGSRTAEVLHLQDFASSVDLVSESQVEIVSCSQCGCGFSDVELDQSTLDQAYQKTSKYADMSVFDTENSQAEVNNSFDSPWDVERLSITADWLASQFPDKHIRVLDAGCAQGTLLAMLKARGFANLTGLDPSPLAIDSMMRRFGISGVAVSFCSPTQDLIDFDLVILSHVLEHIADVESAVRGLSQVLRPGGMCYLEVPDATRYHEYLVAPFHDFNNEHINHFSLPCLSSLMTAHGFELQFASTKEVPIAPGVLYPAVLGLWKKTGVIMSGFSFDSDLRTALTQYISLSDRLLQRIEDSLAQTVGDGQILIWGAGNLAMKLLTSPSLDKSRIVGLVDGSRQRQGTVIGGYTVQAPEDFRSFSGTVLVMSLHHKEAIQSDARSIVDSNSRFISINPQA